MPDARPLRSTFHLDKRLTIAIGLATLIATPITIYYFMSYNSVNGSAIQIASVRRSVSRGFFSSSIISVSFSVEAHIWSYATSVDTRANNPRFSLYVDNYPISGESGWSATFKPYGYLIYSLTFTTYDGTIANAVGQPATNHLDLGMDALVSAGMYSNQITVSDSTTQTFSG